MILLCSTSNSLKTSTIQIDYLLTENIICINAFRNGFTVISTPYHLTMQNALSPVSLSDPRFIQSETFLRFSFFPNSESRRSRNTKAKKIHIYMHRAKKFIKTF